MGEFLHFEKGGVCLPPLNRGGAYFPLFSVEVNISSGRGGRGSRGGAVGEGQYGRGSRGGVKFANIAES